MPRPRADYDSAWKEALERYFPAFLAFFFPHIHEEIDWGRGIAFLDQELRQAIRHAGRGKKGVDKLVKVYRRTGQEAWLLVHIEIQSQKDVTFPRRMLLCNTLLSGRHECVVVSLAVLGDAAPDWKPDGYEYGLWGSEVSIRFPVVKLLEYEERWEELEHSDSPYALLVMAQLRTQGTRRKPESRLEWKLRLLDWLYEHHRDKEDVFLDLFRFMDWMMALPEELEEEFERTAQRREEERNMPKLSHLEQKAMQRGALEEAREAVLDTLLARFQAVPENLAEAVRQTKDTSLLRGLRKHAATTGSLDEFRRALPA